MDNIINAFKLMLGNYANFNGRATKPEFWYAFLAMLCIQVAMSVIVVIFHQVSGILGGLFNIISILISLGLIIPSIALFVRRLHDTNNSGWLALLMLVPIVSLIIFIFFGIKDGDEGDNQFGAPSRNLVS